MLALSTCPPQPRRIQVSNDVSRRCSEYRALGVSWLLLEYKVNHHLLEFVWFLSVYCTKIVKKVEF